MAVDPAVIDAALEDLITAPKKIEVDGLLVEEQPLPDLIALDQYIKAKAVTNAWGSCVRSRVIPPAAIGPGAREDDP